MKSFLEKSKRALVLLLTGAMIATSVPADVFAAPLVTDEDVIFEEGADAVEALGAADEEPVVEEAVDPVDPDYSDADLQIQFNLATVKATNHIYFADGEGGDNPAEMPAYMDVNANGTDKSGTPSVPAASPTRLYRTADSESPQGYKFYLKAIEGYTFAADWVALEYTNYKAAKYDDWNADNTKAPKIALVKDSDYTVTEVSEALRLITIPQATLAKVVTASYFSDAATRDDHQYMPAQIRVTAKTSNEIRNRLVDLPSLTSDLTPATTWSETNRKAVYQSVSGGDNYVTLTGINAYVKNKTVTPGMIKVTYTDTAAGTDPVEYTAVEGTTGDVVTTGTFTGAEKYVVYQTAQDKLYVSRVLSNPYVLKTASLNLSVNGLAVDTNTKTYSVTPNSNVKFYVTGHKTDLVGTTFNTASSATAIKFDVKIADEPGTGREIKSLVAKEVNDGTEIKYERAKPTATALQITTSNDPTYTFTLDNDPQLVDDDLNLTVVTEEAVNISSAVAHGGIYATDGSALSYVETGSTATFEVRPDSGYIVKEGSVKYSIGSGQKQPLTSTGNNIYEITTPITEKLFIYAEYEDAGSGSKKAVTLNDAQNSTNSSSNLHADVFTGSNDSSANIFKTGEGWKKATAAVTGEYYYFTVKPAVGYTESVEYSYGTSTDKTKAVLVRKNSTGGFNVYRTAEVVGTKDITLHVTTTATATLKYAATPNSRVKLSFTDGDTVGVTEDYEFTVTPVETTDSTIAVKKVEYANGSSGTGVKTEIPAVNGKYRIPISVLSATDSTTNGIWIYVTTEETMNSGYTAVFTLTGDSKTNPKLVSTKNADGVITAQSLNLILGDHTGNLTAQFYTNTRVRKEISTAVNTASTSTPKYEGAGISTSTEDKLDAAERITTIATTTNVVANAIGEDTIAAVLKVAGTGAETGNTRVYKATLPVTVTASYTELQLVVTDGTVGSTNGDTTKEPAVTAIMAENLNGAATGTDNDTGKYTAKFTILGKNMQTGKVEEVTANNENGIKISWAFDRDVKDDAVIYYRMATAASVKFADTGSEAVLNNVNAVFVRADKAQTSPITVKAKVTYKGQEDTPVFYTANINIIKAETYLDFATLDVKNAPTVKSGALADPYSQILELATGGQTEATLQYDVYKVIDTLNPGNISTEDNMKKNLAFGSIEKVESAITYEAIVTNTNAKDTNEYIRASADAKGKVTITALKKTVAGNPAKVNVVAKVNGVAVASQKFNVTVVDNVAHGTIFLKFNDSEVKTKVEGVDTIVERSLKADFINGRKTSVVKTNNNVTIADRMDWGIRFTDEVVGGNFTLPTQDDLTPIEGGKNRVLVAWQKGADDTAFFYPGQTIAVANGDEYTAVWMDKYAFPTSEFDSSPGVLKGTKIHTEKEPTYKDNDPTKEVIAYADFTAISGGGTIDTVMYLIERKPLTAAVTGVANLAAIKADSYDKIASNVFVKSDALSASTSGDGTSILTIVGGKITAAADVGDVTSVPVSLKYEGYKNEYGVTFETKSISIVVSKAPGYELELNGGNAKKLNADQTNDANHSNEIAISMKLPNGNPAYTDGSGEGDFIWEWSSSDKTIAEVNGLDATTGRDVGLVTPKKPGTVTVTLKVTDKKGVSVSSTCALTVEANPVTISIKDAAGNDPQVFTNSSDANDARNGLYIIPAQVGKDQATDYVVSADKTVTWLDGSYDNVVARGVAIDANSKIKINTSGVTAAGATGGSELSDKGWVCLNYKYDNKTYAKKLNVSTYYAIGLTAPVTATQFITKDGAELKDSTGNHIAGEARVTTANMVVTPDPTDPNTRSKDHYTYENISLAAFGGVDKATSNAKEFSGWDKGGAADGVVDYTNVIKKLQSDTKDGSDTLVSGAYNLVPVFIKQTIKKVTIAQNTIVLRNEVDAKLATGEINKKTINMTVEPYDSTSELDVVPDKSQLFASLEHAGTYNADDIGVLGYTSKTGAAAPVTTNELTLTSGKYTLPLGTLQTSAANHTGAIYIDNSSKKRHDNFGIAAVTGTTAQRRAGTVVFDIQSNGKTVETVTVYINGYDSLDNVYYENGSTVKNDGRKVTDEVWYFDENGARITGNKILKKADGTRIAIVDGVLASPNSKVNIDGGTYYVGDGGVIVTGWITETGSATTDVSKGVFYADPENEGKVVVNALKEISGKTYYFNASGKVAKASATADLYEKVESYYVDKDGNVAIGDIFKVAGKDRLFRADGTIVAFADVDVIKESSAAKEGKIKVNNITYVIADDDTAKRDDILYDATVTWTTSFPAKVTKGTAAPTLNYTINYKSKNGNTVTPVEKTVTSVPDGDFSATSAATELTFTATPDLTGFFADAEGKTPATAEPLTKKYIFKDGGAEGVAGTYSIKSKTAFTWGDLPATGVPTASLTITYTVTQEDGTSAVETVPTTATVTETTAAGDTKHRSFKAVAATMDEKNPEITDTKIYSVKSGSGMEGIVIEGLQDEYEFAGTPIQPAFYLVDYDIEDGVVLALGTDYTAKYTNNKAAGTGTITITGKGNYAGKNLTASFKIVDPFAEADKTDFADNVKKVVVSADGFTYDGTQKFPKTVTITTKAGETIVYEFDGTSYNKTQGDKEVLITVANNVKAGTATVGAQGKSDAKPKTGKFKIAPLDLAAAGDKLAVTINDGDNAVYEVKGVQPSVEAVYTSEDGDSVLLVQGQDYTLSYKNNKAAGTGTALLKGKKNCSGKKEASFTIDPIDLSQVDTDTVSVLALSGKKVSKVKAVVTDAAGNVIPAKQLTVSIFEAGGDTALAKSAVVPAAFDVKIEANGTNLKDSLEIADLKPVNDFKAKITVDKNWKLTYTGEPIILTDLVDDNNANPFENGKITVKVGSATLVYGEDFEVAGYANNIKKGSMTFTLYGIGNYAGSKSGKVKIVAKTVSKIVAE